MKPLRALREIFSPYELAAGAMLVCYLLWAGAFTFLFALHSRGGLALAVLAVLAGLAARFGTACPGCGKSPLKLFLVNDERRLDGLLYVIRPWPERECSSCGTRLRD